ncbi:thioesterase family protein [Myxococcus xanthus]|nr:hypothetical protein MyxoNM_36125 [Myxococcus xanthus]SDW11044.1 acyl-CoA thioester hydrolase [Myxococcus xanthus]
MKPSPGAAGEDVWNRERMAVLDYHGRGPRLEARRARFAVPWGRRVGHPEDMPDSPLKDFPVVVSFPLHWGEMDAFGHANNTRTFTWFETARIHYFARIGLTGPSGAGDERTNRDGVGPILKATNAEYLRPILFPTRLVAGCRATRIGTSSFTLEHAVAGEDDGVLYTRGSCVIVTLRYATHEKVPVPAELRAAIEALEGRSFSS